MENNISLAVVDDHFILREGLIRLLNKFEGIKVIFEAKNGKELLDHIEKGMKPDVILLDLEMPEMDGIETTIALKQRYPEIKIIILSMHYEEELIYHLMEKGAHGFLSKNTGIDKMVDAVRDVARDGYQYSQELFRIMIKKISNSKKLKLAFKELSDKEIQVVNLICLEFTNKEIADKLCLSIKTVDNYREKILLKTNSKNTAGIVIYAIKYNIVDVSIFLDK